MDVDKKVEEKQRSDLDEISLANWKRIPEELREACIVMLQIKTPKDMHAHWKDQHERGMRIGSDDLMFHHGIGMQIRNALRVIIKDHDLPPVKYDHGEARNWDDFYMGALQALTEVPSGHSV